MPFFTTQNVLNGGEISPQLLARFDQPRYQTGSRVLENCVPMPQGGLTKRPGMRFCGLAAQQSTSQNTRLVPFVFSATQGRILEFSHLSMRVWLPNGTLVAKNGAPYSINTPYTSADLPGLSFAQSADVLYMASANHPPRKLSRYADDDWRFATLNFLPSISAPGAPSLSVHGTDPGPGSVTYSYKVTVIDAATGAESLASPEVSIGASSLTQSYYILITAPAVAGAAEYRFYKKKGGVFGFIGRSTDGTRTFEDRNFGADTEDTPPSSKNPFTGANQYPSLVFFHQQRLGFAASNSKPLTVWLSQSANFESMASSTPPKADDAIEVSLAANRAGRIHWICPDRGALALGTENGEWTLSAREGQVLTPLNCAFEAQTGNGSAPLEALKAGNGLLFVQRGGAVVRELGYTFESDNYQSQDLTILARHLLQDRSITSWTYQQEPFSVVWCALSDGTLAGLTYMRQHDITGWHRHHTDGFVEQLTSIPGLPDDALWLLVRRTKLDQTGKPVTVRTVEVLSPFFDSPEPASAFFLDSGLSYTGLLAQVFTGLGHLEGREVACLADGAVHPPCVVKNGTVTLERQARHVHVGLPYTGRVIPTLPETINQNGSTLLKVRSIRSVKLRLYRSMNFYVRMNNGLAQPLTHHRLVAGDANGGINPAPWWAERADIALMIGNGWDENASLECLMPDPVPTTLLALVTSLDIASQV